MKRICLPVAAYFCFYLPTFAQFKVVGYVTVSKYFQPDYERIQFNKLTHINLAFINPDSTGSFSTPKGLDSLILVAHTSGVKVLASIGGGNSPATISQLLEKENRNRFIDSIVFFINLHNLDGEDIDLEGDAVDKNYSSFVKELGIKLKKEKKLFTAAVAGYYADKIPNTLIESFDFINIMSYDYKGPWTPKEPGQHSAYYKAVEDINFWTIKRGIPKKKVILGVPFYGYNFSKDTITGLSFRTITQFNMGAEQVDSFKINDSSTVYYNGLITMRKKIKLALAKAGGIMIWQLYQDAGGDQSLLNLITQELIDNKKRKGSINNK